MPFPQFPVPTFVRHNAAGMIACMASCTRLDPLICNLQLVHLPFVYLTLVCWPLSSSFGTIHLFMDRMAEVQGTGKQSRTLRS